MVLQTFKLQECIVFISKVLTILIPVVPSHERSRTLKVYLPFQSNPTVIILIYKGDTNFLSILNLFWDLVVIPCFSGKSMRNLVTSQEDLWKALEKAGDRLVVIGKGLFWYIISLLQDDNIRVSLYFIFLASVVGRPIRGFTRLLA